MKVWIDALTPKQARLAAHIYTVLKSRGFEVLVTTRDYDLTRHILEKLGVEHRVVGRHGGLSLASKLEADVERMARLIPLIREFKPDVLVSYPSPSAVRVAYGLALPIIVFSDSPHSVPVHLLTVPLADFLVYSSLIPRQMFERFASFKTRLVGYYGVEEVGWVRGHRCNDHVLSELGLEKDEYIVVRMAEWMAEYYRGYGKPPLLEIIETVEKRGLKIVVLPRYREDYEILQRLASRHKNLRIVWGFAVESLDLYCWSRLVVTGGATMAREAALMCKQAVSLYPVYVNEVLRSLGFPLYTYNLQHTDLTTLLKDLEAMIEEPRTCRPEAKRVLENFEEPGTVLLRILEGLK